jgi:hypothetical protein
VAELCLYADLPHTVMADGEHPPEPDGARVEVHRLDPETLRRKLDTARLYRSQLSALDEEAPDGWIEEERVWRL